MIIDQFTKWLDCYPLPDQEAETVATSFIEGFLYLDWDVQYSSTLTRVGILRDVLFQEVCRLLQITKTRITPYRHCSSLEIQPSCSSGYQMLMENIS